MYRVLLADDDMIVRVGIKMIGKWQNYHMEVTGEASDGRQAYSLFRETSPHLIITDIRMPGLDGLSLLKKIREEDKKVRILMLTNYDDKDYLKEAIRLGANDFIMKNELNEENFDSILSREYSELQEIYQNSSDISLCSHNLLRKKQFVNLLMEPHTDEAYLKNEFNELFLQNKEKPFHAGILYINCKKDLSDGAVPSISRQLTCLSEIVTGVLTAYPDSVIIENKGFFLTVFLFTDDCQLPETRWKELCQSIRDALSLYAVGSFHIGASCLITSADDLTKLKYQADQAILAASFHTESILVLYDTIGELHLCSELNRSHLGMLKKIYISDFSDKKEIRRICRILLGEIRRTNNLKLKKMFCNEFSSWYNRVAGMMNLEETGVMWRFLDFQTLLNAFDHKELENDIEQFIEHLSALKEENQSTGNSFIDDALAYIHMNYASSISLGDAAGHVHLSKNYFSTLFSEVLGVSFVDYLTNYRIRKAADILWMTDYRINETAGLVGFTSERYFSQTFKNVLGISPSEYRNMLKNETEPE